MPSRSQIKEIIFDTLADFFERTGTTTCLTVNEIVQKTGDRSKRVQSLFDEMVKEGVIYQGCEAEDGYRLRGMAYTELCVALEN